MICVMLDGSTRCNFVTNSVPDIYLEERDFEQLIKNSKMRISIFNWWCEQVNNDIKALLIASLGEKETDGTYHDFNVKLMKSDSNNLEKGFGVYERL